MNSGTVKVSPNLAMTSSTAMNSSIAGRDVIRTVNRMSNTTQTNQSTVNNLDEMWRICHDCAYWEICKPPYDCAATEEMLRNGK